MVVSCLPDTASFGIAAQETAVAQVVGWLGIRFWKPESWLRGVALALAAALASGEMAAAFAFIASARMDWCSTDTKLL